MERVIEAYQTHIKQLLSQYAAFTTDRSSVETIFDDEQMRYMAIRLGWQHEKRI